MGNYRSKLSKAGVKDVSINSGKRSHSCPGGAPSRSGIKRARRGEVNFLPDYPSGESKDTLDGLRLQMISEMQKVSAERDMALIYQLMQHTFALRREEIINSAMPIAEVKNRWPALFCQAQLYKEFHRITNQNLPYTFLGALDKAAPRLLQLYENTKGTWVWSCDDMISWWAFLPSVTEAFQDMVHCSSSPGAITSTS
ncbi:hypothetical protein ACEWY4_025435 [Coilia grayii]|uniref:Uncharacterized protein n=1 Tax=Coilia grayii TaxID=363190 RepID=A0ABD1IXN0_9TELE